MQDSLNGSCGQYLEIPKVSGKQLDKILSLGWRHFGTFFYYDVLTWHEGGFRPVLPLRINLEKFKLSKSLRKIIRKNTQVEVVIRPAFIDDRKHEVFDSHCRRFKSNIPDSIYDFLSKSPSNIPCDTIEICLFDKDRLFAVSFLDLGKQSTSSVYAMFDPEYSSYSPGIYTLLLEIEYTQNTNRKYLYTGYAFKEDSHYNYKKRFVGTEYFDWQGHWSDLEIL